LADVRAAYPKARVMRAIPSTPVEVRAGVVVLAQESDEDPEVEALLERLGLLVRLPESLIDVAMGLMSNAPAYVALVAEAQIDAGVRHGMPADLAAQMVVQTLAGTAELIKRRDYDTLGVRRAVTSPGGSTARGLAALERAKVRAAFQDALDAVLEGRR
jgi:pyrroline-5-carboxylate reductase